MHTYFSDIYKFTIWKSFKEVQSRRIDRHLGKRMDHSKYLTMTIFESACDNEFLTLKIHLMDHLAPDIHEFLHLNSLDSAPYEQAQLFKEQSRKTSGRRSTEMEETFRTI